MSKLAGGAAVLVMLLVLARCGGGETTPSFEPAPTGEPAGAGPGVAGVTVTMVDLNFQPASITIAPGTTVTWHNEDGVSHTVTSEEGGFDSGQLAPTESFTRTFDTAGTFPYLCHNHPRMEGVVVVGEGGEDAEP